MSRFSLLSFADFIIFLKKSTPIVRLSALLLLFFAPDNQCKEIEARNALGCSINNTLESVGLN